MDPMPNTRLNVTTITDDHIRALHKAHVINDWSRDVALTTILGLDGERRMMRAMCARLWNRACPACLDIAMTGLSYMDHTEHCRTYRSTDLAPRAGGRS